MVRISEGSGSMSEFKRDRKDYHMVGKCVPKKDSNQLLLGKPVFMDDIVPQDCLVVKLLRSPHAHALVEEVKTVAAAKVPGIEAIYTWKDVPKERFCIAGQTYPEPSPYDRLILDQRVRCVGDPVAIVAGENEKAVDKALRLIKVKYQVLEPVLDFRKALDNEVLVHPEENWKSYGNTGDVKRNLLHHEEDAHGDVEQILSECDEVIEHSWRIKAAQQGYMETIRAYNEKYGQEVRVEMVSLQELYAAIAPKLTDAPVYRGDWTDWWANGVGSTPYAVKHYKDADHRWQLANRLDPDAETHYPALAEAVQDNLMLYAEHTWGHSSTITNPYDTMVLNLDMRKNSYASKAHEAASLMLCSIAEKKGDMLRYYNTTGTVRAVGVSYTSQPQLIEFYIETLALEDVEVRDLAGNLYTCQVSPHPRGRKISFIDTLSYGEEKEYTYAARHKAPETLNTRHCYMGAEEVRDIVNDYDPVTYRLPYEVENKFFRICYKPGDGITSFVDKRTGTEMAGTAIPFFTPVYQRTPLHQEVPFSSYEERRALGRNIRGKHAETHIGKLMEITCMEHGPVFTQLRLHYSLAGTVKADVLLKLYEAIPRIDFTLELGKTISDEVESVFLSLDLNRPGNGTVLRKGAREAFRPGIDQLPGTCMEFYMSDDGAARLSPEGGVLIAARDVPMFYTGEMQHHPIRLCDGAAENNARPLYSWVMNNNWETNFKMDLSGFCQYDYSLWLTDISDPEQAMDELHEQLFDPYVLIVR